MYVDGFVIAILKKNMKAYKKMATIAGKVWKKHGAVGFVEAVAEDLKTHPGSLSFTKMAKLKKGETVLFSFIVFKSRKHRDQVNTKVMKDPAMDPEGFMGTEMPFQMNRMAYAGFKAIVDL